MVIDTSNQNIFFTEPDADLYNTHPKKQDDAQATLPSSKNDERVGTSETPTMGSV